ncbi:MAG TPA: 8-amino-7-oxononanoate synthase [Polyangiaceae bacterium]|nr:8-amino-7-oxononanoate synthase [Polyangiaceae bacterium]
MLRIDRFADERLRELEREGLLRRPDDGGRRRAAQEAAEELGTVFVDASSNDYLGLAELDVSRETGVQGSALGAGASRLIHGSRRPHVELETALADWVRLPTALLSTSGYAANVGLMGALGRPGSVIVSDRLNHASIIDGCRLSRAEVVVTPHLDLAAIDAALKGAAAIAARWVVVESCFSMDGDGPDLRKLRALCDDHDAGLIVDEAHALGVFGPEGAGRCAEAGVTPDVLVGTLGKAVGSQGAFVAGSAELRALLWNDARSFVFSTAPSPRLSAWTLLHVERARRANDRRGTLFERALELRTALAAHGIAVESGLGGAIIPVVIGDNQRVLAVVAELERSGILAQGIRPPTVPAGTARLRLTATATWSADVPSRVADAIARALQNPG